RLKITFPVFIVGINTFQVPGIFLGDVRTVFKGLQWCDYLSTCVYKTRMLAGQALDGPNTRALCKTTQYHDCVTSSQNTARKPPPWKRSTNGCALADRGCRLLRRRRRSRALRRSRPYDFAY